MQNKIAGGPAKRSGFLKVPLRHRYGTEVREISGFLSGFSKYFREKLLRITFLLYFCNP
ncbi:hypothetical protein [Alistipes intestinihominis]|uniref:Uncharacterized protein n=1 Tax=Alistipes intestinihominis TaxID=3133172 RepID=A0ABV1GUJ9_9BACT